MSAQSKIEIECIDRLGVLLTKKQRIIILVGSRGSTKSTFVADVKLAKAAAGRVICCGREYQNTIEDSVHSLLSDEIERLEWPGFEILKTEINHISGGRLFYRGLARNITSMKSIVCDDLWIEEGETLSDDTLRVLTASIRASAKEQTIAKREGREVRQPQIWITMNRGSSKDPISKRYLARAEKALARCGYYEDSFCVIMEVNYDEMPYDWFVNSGLEEERLDDLKYLSTAAYDHKWKGAYSDTIENAIIEPDWFDLCIDAHKVLGFEPSGLEVVSYDATGGGQDPGAMMHRHGAVFLNGQEYEETDPNANCDRALEYTLFVKPDSFIWDANAIGASLKRQVVQALEDKKIDIHMFLGQGSVANPDAIYDPTPGSVIKQKKNKELFANIRAQRYWDLRDRCYRTYLAVKSVREGKKALFTNVDELVSFDSSMPVIGQLRSEVCRIPRLTNRSKITIMGKDKMKEEGIPSPNLADCCMMSLDVTGVRTKRQTEDRTFVGWG